MIYAYFWSENAIWFLQIIFIYHVNDHFRIDLSLNTEFASYMQGPQWQEISCVEYGHPPGTAVTCSGMPKGTQINKGSYSSPNSRQRA
jgi:hypothetical protein